MSGFAKTYDFLRAMPDLIDDGASLRDLYDAMRTVPELADVDVSPERLHVLATHWTQWPSFVPIRLAELFGGARVAHTDDYVLAMIGGFGARGDGARRAFLIRNDDELRDGVLWRIFEVEGGGEISLANIDKYSSERAGWQRSITELVADGTLDRARVLRSCLQALNRDFSAYRAGWFSRLYAELTPAPGEAAADQELLRLCLGSTVTATVSLAVAQLAAVQKAGLLEEEGFAEAASFAVSGPKGTALTVIRMLRACRSAGEADGPAAEAGVTARAASPSTEPARSADEGKRIDDALVLALGHPHADVQRAAIKALMARGRAGLIEARRAGLAPAVVAELAPAVESGIAAAALEGTGLRPETVGAVAVLSGAGDGMEPATAPEQGAAEALLAELPAAEPLLPWSDEEAVAGLAILLEEPGDALAFERALAWLSAAEDPGRVLAPLAKRAAKRLHSGAEYPAVLVRAAMDPGFEVLPQEFFRSTATTWTPEGPSVSYGPSEPRPAAEQLTVIPNLVARLREVAEIVQGRSPRRLLLATPTDTRGWIDPDAFRARLAAQPAAPLAADLAQATVRLQPEHRAALLGESGIPEPEITASLTIDWIGRESESRTPSGAPQWVFWHPRFRASGLTAFDPLRPAAIPSSPESGSLPSSSMTLALDALGIACPESTLPLVVPGIELLRSAAEERTPVGEETILRVLARHPGRWTAETVQLVGLGMAAKRAEVRALAAEVFAAVVPMRASARVAAEGFAGCAPVVVLSRWASSFADAAGLVPDAVIDVLTVLLPRIERDARGAGALLTVLLDESIRAGRGVADPVLRGWLEGFSGSSGAARAARALRSLVL